MRNSVENTHVIRKECPGVPVIEPGVLDRNMFVALQWPKSSYLLTFSHMDFRYHIVSKVNKNKLIGNSNLASHGGYGHPSN